MLNYTVLILKVISFNDMRVWEGGPQNLKKEPQSLKKDPRSSYTIDLDLEEEGEKHLVPKEKTDSK